MKGILYILGMLIAVQAVAQDKVVLKQGTTVNCKIVSYEGDQFACEMPDGSIKRLPAYRVKKILFGEGVDDATAVENKKDVIKGRFYVSVDDYAALYLNGKCIQEASPGESYSEEVSIGPDDLLLIQLVNTGGSKHFRFAFLSTDREKIISFKYSDLKELEQQPFSEITIDTIKKSKNRVNKARNVADESVLPDNLREKSDAIWGEKNKCLIGVNITQDMITDVK